MTKIQPVILSGGSGSRLWPLSREHYPKQLLALVSENSLLQDTVIRLKQGEDSDLTVKSPLLIFTSNTNTSKQHYSRIYWP